jgi:hypothetical protein
MTKMQRWVFPLGVERKPAAEGDSRVKYVLASDAEAAIAAARAEAHAQCGPPHLSLVRSPEQHHYLCACDNDGESICNHMCMYCSCSRIAKAKQNAILAAIRQVQALPYGQGGPDIPPFRDRALAALRELKEKP